MRPFETFDGSQGGPFFLKGLAAQIEREFISTRTKESLQKLKQEGVKLGRPMEH